MQQAWLDELDEFIRIPSVSADPAHRDDVARAAEWLAEFVKRAGGEAEVVAFGERELVLGDIPASTGRDARTVLVYGHFDVQPPAPLDQWQSNPFELDVRDGWAYARGVADDKGLLYTVVKAAQLLVRDGALPVNLRIASDGEEEIGGHTIVDFLAQDERGADACVIFDGGPFRAEQPEFAIATRGLVGFHVKVKTGSRDLHSGLYGGAALNAQHALMKGLMALAAGEDGRLPAPLREGIGPVAEEEREGWRALPPGADLLREAGALPLDARAADEFYARTWTEPSMDVNGIRGGKPDLVNTTLVVEAEARFTVRLAPGQDAAGIAEAAERLLREAIPAGAVVEVERENNSPPGLFSPDSPVIRLGQDAVERALGRRPILVRSGGTLPIVPALVEKGIDTILSGFALPESNVHSPNERMRLEDLQRSVEAARALYAAFADLP